VQNEDIPPPPLPFQSPLSHKGPALIQAPFWERWGGAPGLRVGTPPVAQPDCSWREETVYSVQFTKNIL
jgi:hypothetical protein